MFYVCSPFVFAWLCATRTRQFCACTVCKACDGHHVEPRVQLYVPKEESFPIPLQYIDVTRTKHTNLDVLQESDDCGGHKSGCDDSDGHDCGGYNSGCDGSGGYNNDIGDSSGYVKCWDDSSLTAATTAAAMATAVTATTASTAAVTTAAAATAAATAKNDTATAVFYTSPSLTRHGGAGSVGRGRNPCKGSHHAEK